MNKLLLATTMALAVALSACGSKDAAPAGGSKASAAASSSKQAAAPAAASTGGVKPQIVAPKPPPPPGGGKPAPELKPEDIARIQAMLAKQKASAPADKSSAK